MKEDGNDGKNGSDGVRDKHPIFPPRGDYRTLLSFQKAEVVYDITFRFARKFLGRGDRTIDQMVQAARSGKNDSSKGPMSQTGRGGEC